jgi:hypothetical protein
LQALGFLDKLPASALPFSITPPACISLAVGLVEGRPFAEVSTSTLSKK